MFLLFLTIQRVANIVIKGRIIKGINGLYDVLTFENADENIHGGRVIYGDRIITCHARGLFRYENTTVSVGDYVLAEETDDDHSAIMEIIERRNILIRPPLANLDILYTVIAAEYPDPDLVLFDKLISIAEFNKIEPVIVITKSDLNAEKTEYISTIYKKAGFEVIIGISGLYDYAINNGGDKTAAFAGVSGVGKSTLLNKLFSDNIPVRTGGLSARIRRGKQTTGHVELFRLSRLAAKDTHGKDLSRGFIADTPGFSLLDFTKFVFYDKEDLPFNFREFAPYITECRYSSCTHTKEEGCAVLEAVRDGVIAAERHKSYIEIYADLKLKDKHKWDVNK
jgi:ribosome biogenesis GTPase